MVFQSFSTWQFSHFLPKRPRCPLSSSSFLWHEKQSVGASVYTLDLWQSSHLTLGSACPPLSGKLVLLWSNCGVSFQSFSVWQLSHLSPSTPLCLSSFWWQTMHWVFSLSLYTSLPVWQSWHLTFLSACLPRSGYLVSLSWSNLMVFQSLSVWHASHFGPKRPLWPFLSSSFLWHSLQAI